MDDLIIHTGMHKPMLESPYIKNNSSFVKLKSVLQTSCLKECCVSQHYGESFVGACFQFLDYIKFSSIQSMALLNHSIKNH